MLSAANEIAVSAFVEGEIRLGQIPEIIERTIAGAKPEELSLDGVRRADAVARKNARATVLALRQGIEV